MNLDHELKKHFEEDRLKAEKDIVSFKRVEDKLLEQQNNHEKTLEKLNTILIHVKTSNDFMENMSGLNDFVRGTALLKRPALWLLALILGIVALFGGLKSLLLFFTPVK